MSVCIADASNSSYDGNIATANGFYRGEAFNTNLASSALPLSSEIDIPVTFAHSGNCQGVILALGNAGNKSVTVALQQFSGSWSTVASVALTAAQIHALTDTSQLDVQDNFIIAFTGGTFPFAVTTAAGTWRFAVTSTGAGTADWSIRTSDSVNPFYITWCDNKISFTSGSDFLVCKDSVTINANTTLKGQLGTGDANTSSCGMVLSSSTPMPNSVAKLLWQNPPLASYTLTLDGFFIVPSHGGVRVGTAASPIPAAQQAIIVNSVPTTGLNTRGGFAGFSITGTSGTKSNYFFYGAIPAVENAILQADAATGQNQFVTTTTTGWVNGDQVMIGGCFFQGLGDTTIYTVSSSSGGTVTLTGNIATYLRKAGGRVVKVSGYGIAVSSGIASSGAFCNVLAPTNLQLSGVSSKDAQWTGNGANAVKDDANNYDTVGIFASHCVFYTDSAVPSQNYTSLCSRYPNTIDHCVFARTSTSFSIPATGNRNVTISNSIVLFQTTAISGLISVNLTVQNCDFENTVASALSLAGQTTVTGCRFYGIGATGGALQYSTSFGSIYTASNTFDNCTVGVSPLTGCVDAVDYYSQFGQVQSNGTDVALASAQTNACSLTLVSPTGTMGVNPAFTTTPWTQVAIANVGGIPNNDIVYTTYATFQRTGPGLADTTSNDGGYALRVQSTGTYVFPFVTYPFWGQSKVIPTGNLQNQTLTVSAAVQMANATFYAGSHTNPTLNVRYDGTSTGTAVASDVAGTWQQLALSITPQTTSTFIEAWISANTDATGTNSYYYIDSFNVAYPPGVSLNLGKMDIFGKARPFFPPLSTFPSSTAIQTLMAKASPLATTETLLYTVPANALSCVVSSIVVCNRGNTATTFRISVSANSAATVVGDYLYYDVSIGGNDTFIATVGVTPSATAAIRVYAGSTSLSFSLWGSLVS